MGPWARRGPKLLVKDELKTCEGQKVPQEPETPKNSK